MFKRLKIGLTTTLLTLIAAGCFGVDISDSGRVFDTAIINYEWSGVIKGKETIYIDGEKTRSEINTTTTINGAEINQSRVIINDGEYIYKIDNANKLALKEPSPYKDKLKSFNTDEKHEFRKRLALLLNDNDPLPSPEGEETIMGYKCEVYSVTGPYSSCIWEGVALRNELAIDSGKAKQKAVSLETNINLPENLFLVPEDVKIQEVQ